VLTEAWDFFPLCLLQSGLVCRPTYC